MFSNLFRVSFEHIWETGTRRVLDQNVCPKFLRVRAKNLSSKNVEPYRLGGQLSRALPTGGVRKKRLRFGLAATKPSQLGPARRLFGGPFEKKVGKCIAPPKF